MDKTAISWDSSQGRLIYSVYLNDSISPAAQVGKDGVTSIQSDWDSGSDEGPYELWFIVFQGEKIFKRLNGKYVGEVVYV